MSPANRQGNLAEELAHAAEALRAAEALVSLGLFRDAANRLYAGSTLEGLGRASPVRASRPAHRSFVRANAGVLGFFARLDDVRACLRQLASRRRRGRGEPLGGLGAWLGGLGTWLRWYAAGFGGRAPQLDRRMAG